MAEPGRLQSKGLDLAFQAARAKAKAPVTTCCARLNELLRATTDEKRREIVKRPGPIGAKKDRPLEN